MDKNGTMSVAEAAERLGVSAQCVRVGLDRGIFKFGQVVPMKRKVYLVYREKFEELTGINTKGETKWQRQ